MIAIAGVWGDVDAGASALEPFTDGLDVVEVPGGAVWTTPASGPGIGSTAIAGEGTTFCMYGDRGALAVPLPRASIDATITTAAPCYLRGAGVAASRDRLVLWTDLTGACPLFHTRRADGTVVFASEAKALRAAAGTSRLRGEPHRRPLPPAGDSNFVGVARVSPGSMVTVPARSAAAASERQLAWLPEAPVVVDPDDARQLVHDTLVHSVGDAVADVAHASVALSGGVDSTTMAALARTRVAALDAWTVGTEEHDEFAAAEEAAALVGASHRRLTMTTSDFVELLPEMIWSLETWDGPTLEILAPLAFLYRELRRLGRSEVLLLGYGADILFGGAVDPALAEPELERALLHQAAMMAPTNELSAALPARWGVAVRYPYWTSTMLKVGFLLRGRVKLRGDVVKDVLRRVSAQYLPQHVAWRPKQGIHVGAGTKGLLAEVLGTADRVEQRRRLRALAEDVFAAGGVARRDELLAGA